MEINDISLAKASEDTLTGAHYNLTLGFLTIEQAIEVLKALRESKTPELSEKDIPDCGTGGTGGGHWYFPASEIK